MNSKKLTLLVLGLSLCVISCESYTPEEVEYIKTIESEREDDNEWMKDNQDSPFNKKTKVEFSGLNYFDVDPDFVFKSKVYQYDDRKDIPIFGTKGEERSAIRFGYLSFKKDDINHRLNLYANIGQDSSVYYSIWFTDKTTNDESYGVGRYLSFELKPNKEYLYKIDFNKAFNPYCAYSPEYSCAMPSKDDYLDLAITAGEKKYHD